MGRLWRVHQPDVPGEPGAEFELAADQARHVHRVLRLAAEEPIAVFDGRGGEWRCVVVSSERDRVRARVVAPIRAPVEPSLPIRLFQGLCRPERMEWVIEKATEIGVTAVHVWTSRRAKPYGITDNRLARWRRIAAESCKQCGRRKLPRIEAGERLPQPPDGTLGLLLDPAEEAEPLRDALHCRSRPVEVWLAVGPESGLAADEIADAGTAWVRVALGPRVLRSDTAGIVAASIVLAEWGDLGSPGGAIADC